MVSAAEWIPSWMFRRLAPSGAAKDGNPEIGRRNRKKLEMDRVPLGPTPLYAIPNFQFKSVADYRGIITPVKPRNANRHPVVSSAFCTALAFCSSRARASLPVFIFADVEADHDRRLLLLAGSSDGSTLSPKAASCPLFRCNAFIATFFLIQRTLSRPFPSLHHLLSRERPHPHDIRRLCRPQNARRSAPSTRCRCCFATVQQRSATFARIDL